MKRRNVLTAVGTLALGVGTALGTGAVDVVSSNSDGSFRVVSPGADIRIDPADSVGADVLKNQTIDFGSLEPSDLPVATVSENNGQMVTIQVAVTAAEAHNFGDILKITNNNSDGIDYEVAFDYTGFGPKVDDGTIPQSDVIDTFEFTHGSTVVSSNSGDQDNDPTNFVTVSPGSPETIGLYVNKMSSIENAVTAGSFTGNSDSTVLIDEVTAIANQL
ncbi:MULTISPECIES: hypothetical protein [Haloferax]|uniref:DUF1102 domain-containing protein n=2 Tax=Haloferax TaxID=2251 RepID=A0A6G1Z0V6_9EURY|nr:MULTISPECIES: hypothetical protein [Haloferax]KAB1187473.1 hypothetical protein Hfx1149_05285 [Haloferax sp. CBA1149]MRW80125.1 hypothetical protein [Haloferax marinisediminis]